MDSLGDPYRSLEYGFLVDSQMGTLWLPIGLIIASQWIPQGLVMDALWVPLGCTIYTIFPQWSSANGDGERGIPAMGIERIEIEGHPSRTDMEGEGPPSPCLPY